MPEIHRLTQAAHDRLVAELEELRTVGRVEAAERIERAREHGDLKENAEYHSAKEEKSKMEARVARIFSILEHHEIVESGGEGLIDVGSIVTLHYDDEGPDDAEKYLLGSIEERHDGVDHVVSPTSPMGEALMGKAVGDTVTYASPTGELTVVVTHVE
ncbi:MAG: GreA/GreB family elongation factor [Actinomycetes bacterium]